MSRRYPFERKIADFEHATHEQVLDAAQNLLGQKPPYNLAALRLLVSYFEPIGKYTEGFSRPGRSRHYFIKGCRDVIVRRTRNMRRLRPPTEVQLSGFYEIVRCGLAHGATLSFNAAIGVGPYGLAISTDGAKISANPAELLNVLRSDLDTYLAGLRNPREHAVRAKFEARWDYEAHL